MTVPSAIIMEIIPAYDTGTQTRYTWTARRIRAGIGKTETDKSEIDNNK